jgi:N-acetylglucosaminyl-diphospho-decaprenol L-rhamnosyltransferase
MSPLTSFSVVSHGQSALLRHLLTDLRQLADESHEIILTLNIPEDERFLEDFRALPIRLVRNDAIKGFGANHNAAFALSRGDTFVVVNPDIRAPNLNLRALRAALDAPGVGACAPVVLSSRGTVEDSARKFPTFSRLAYRTLTRRRVPDYRWNAEQIAVDWVAGMFVAFRRDAFQAVGGFDERFFMYLEDADICRRLKRRGWATVLQPACTVVHDAQRDSHRKLGHLRRHVVSAARYLTGI